jgi:hypothetical protein
MFEKGLDYLDAWIVSAARGGKCSPASCVETIDGEKFRVLIEEEQNYVQGAFAGCFT